VGDGLTAMGADCSARPGSVLDAFTVIDSDYPEKAAAIKGRAGAWATQAAQRKTRSFAKVCRMHKNNQPMSMVQILLCGGAVVTLSMGIRHGFGLWLQPITQEMGWTRESFALAIAIQNLSWGVLGIFGGMLADRFGAFRVLLVGALLYALGLAGMAMAPTTTWFALTAGVVIGAAQAGTTYAVIYGVLGRQIPVARRSWAMGVTAAAGSFGQFFMVPVEGSLISNFGWSNALLLLSLYPVLADSHA